MLIKALKNASQNPDVNDKRVEKKNGKNMLQKNGNSLSYSTYHTSTIAFQNDMNIRLCKCIPIRICTNPAIGNLLLLSSNDQSRFLDIR